MSQSPPEPATETRERLLDAAEALFARRGLSGTSVREITEAAGANLAAINYHFRSKENLYVEVFLRRMAQMRDPVIAATRVAAPLARRSAHEALLTVGRAFLAPHEDKAASVRMLNLFARETIDGSLPPGLLIRELIAPTEEAIAKVVRSIRPSLSEAAARSCARSFTAQLLHIVKGATVGLGPADDQIDHTVRFTVAAVKHIDPSPVPKRRRSS